MRGDETTYSRQFWQYYSHSRENSKCMKNGKNLISIGLINLPFWPIFQNRSYFLFIHNLYLTQLST